MTNLGVDHHVAFGRDGSVVLRTAARRLPLPGEVAVEVRFAGINPTDHHHLMRVVRDGDEAGRVPGVEVAGVVRKVGDGVERWSTGDRVFGLVREGGLASRTYADGSLLMPVPESLDEAEAAATPEAFITAHDALAQASLAAGETVLVTGASGAVGLAAVQLAVAAGAHVIGTTRSAEARALVTSLGATAVPDHMESRPASLPYKDAVDVVIELIGARNARSTLAALAPGGRCVFIGARGDEHISFRLADFKTKQLTFIGSTMRRRDREAKVAAIRHFQQEALPLIAAGQVTPRISRIYPASRVQEAFTFLGEPGKFGRVLLDFTG